jgi:exo-1,4-beta-D-glucosaminidase
VRESIERFVPADQLWPMGPSWSYHCTTSGSAMNSLAVMTEVIDAKYGAATGLDDYLRKADMVSYESTRSMFEAFRANKPRTTGLIQWMLNSAWPSLYWQLYDYYGVPTSSYWAVKRACAPWQLVYNYKDNGIYLVNELAEGAQGMKATVRVYGIDSKLLSEQEMTVGAEADSSKKICDIDPALAPVTFVALALSDADGRPLADNFYALTPRHDVYDYARNEWYMTPIAKYADFRAMASMPAAALEFSVGPCPKGTPGKLHIEVKNTSGVIALNTTLKLKNADGEVAAPVFWSDNYFSLAPGESRTLSVDASGHDLATLALTAAGWNVAPQTVAIK